MNFDIRKFNQALIVLLAVGILMVGILQGHVLSNRYLGFGVPIVLAGFMLIGNMGFLWSLLVMISGSNLAAGNTTLFAVLAFAYSGAGLLVVLMHKGDRTPMQTYHKWLICLAILSMLIPAIRGLGIRALGSDMWGGIQYFTLWGGLGICLFSNKMRVSEKALIRAIIVMLIVGAVPGFLRYFNELAGGRLDGLGSFFKGVSVGMIDQPLGLDASGADDTKRLEGIQQSGLSLILLSMALMTWKKRTPFKILAISFLGMLILGLAGYRSTMMHGLATAGLYYLLMKKHIPANIKKASVLIGLIALISLPFLLPYLPFGFQRMFAWVPGVNISIEAYESAHGTSEWRVEMWRKVLPMLKDYWLIGRGLAFDLTDAYGSWTLASDRTTMHEFFIATHQYHNGPLYLLVDYGIPGFIFATGFMFSSVRIHWRYAKREWSDVRLKNLHAVLLARHTANVIMFFIIFGAITSLMVMFVDVLLMTMLCKIYFSKGEVIRLP